MSHSVDRRDFLKLIGAAGLSALGRPLAGAGKDERPNILFIMSDDHAAHALGCYGSTRGRTPCLDRLAREGVRFTNAFVTNALCAPSRATLLTGKYSHLNGLKDNATDFDGSQVTFPKLLQKAGYTTALIGKWHLRTDPTGFDYWNILPGQGIYENPQFIEMGERKTVPGYVTDVITDLAIRYLSERKEAQPFCLVLHHKATHRPWSPDDGRREEYRNKRYLTPRTFDDDYTYRSSAASHADMRIANMPDYEKEAPSGLSPEERKKWNYNRYMRDYFANAECMDEGIGRVLDYLKDSGLEKNTIVVYTSDNGFFLGEHGYYDKRFMYEESIRVPLLIRYPGETRPGRTESRFVVNTDFAPTFLDYAKAGIPADMQGHSLRPLMTGSDAPAWRKSVYYHYYEYPLSHRVREHYGVRTDRYKLIHYYTIGEWELFDLKTDPWEMHSVYDDARYRDVVKDMKAELERLRKELKVPAETSGGQ